MTSSTEGLIAAAPTIDTAESTIATSAGAGPMTGPVEASIQAAAENGEEVVEAVESNLAMNDAMRYNFNSCS